MTVGHTLAMALRDAYWSMHRQTDACLGRRGVTANQFVLLALLAERDGITQRELVRRASSDQNTVRAMLVLLETQELVARGPHPNDRRALSVTITEKGREVFDRLMAEVEPLQKALLGVFAEQEAKDFVQALRRISEAMTDSEMDDRSP